MKKMMWLKFKNIRKIIPLVGLILIFSCYLCKNINGMGTKKFKKEHFEIINSFLGEKGYLSREQIKELTEKFNFCNTIMLREFLENKIPIKSGFVSVSLKSIGIENDGKKISYEKIKHFREMELTLIKNSKIKIEYVCQECGKKSNSRACNMIKRDFFSFEPICSLCINKKVTNTEKWKKTNSIAQKIAQNKPEQIKKNRDAQIKRFKDPEVRKKHSEASKKTWKNPEYRKKMIKIAQDKWKDPIYAQKVIKNSKNSFNCGYYKGLYYDSGYELAYMIKLEEEGNFKKLKRANFYIMFIDKNNKKRYYYPDFVFEKKYVIEVKGYGPWIDLETLSLKNKYAKKWCKENDLKYRLVELKDFGYHYYRKAKKIHKNLKNENSKKNYLTVQRESL